MIMEEKKFDKQSMIGFLLIGAILLFMLWQNQPTEEELAAQKAQEEQVEAQEAAARHSARCVNHLRKDSVCVSTINPLGPGGCFATQIV